MTEMRPIRQGMAGALNAHAERLGEAMAFWAVVVFAFVLLFASSWIPAAQRLRSLKEQEKLVGEEIALIKAENERIENRLNGLYNDSYYLERILRKEHGFLKEGEKVLKPGYQIAPPTHRR